MVSPVATNSCWTVIMTTAGRGCGWTVTMATSGNGWRGSWTVVPMSCSLGTRASDSLGTRSDNRVRIHQHFKLSVKPSPHLPSFVSLGPDSVMIMSTSQMRQRPTPTNVTPEPGSSIHYLGLEICWRGWNSLPVLSSCHPRSRSVKGCPVVSDTRCGSGICNEGTSNR